MNMTIVRAVLAAAALLACGAAATAAPARETREVRGWTLHIDRALLATNEATTTARAVELLGRQLDEIVRVVPSNAVAELRKVPLYFSPPYANFSPRAEFHPDPGWLRANGRDPAMAKAVEFTDTREFEREMDRMPNFTLHELAHAFHNRAISGGFANGEIKAAYERAKRSGRYDQVERWNGGGRRTQNVRAYAMTDPMEYFAENSEAYFSRNDFFPFTREELKQFDPEGHAVIEKAWGVK